MGKSDQAPPAPEGNISKLMEDVKSAAAKVNTLSAKRQGINDDINAIRHDMEAKGISRKAFDAALAYSNQDPEKREGFDVAYSIAREAMGVPLQGDLFDGDKPPATTESGQEKAPATGTKGKGTDAPAPTHHQSGTA